MYTMDVYRIDVYMMDVYRTCIIDVSRMNVYIMDVRTGRAVMDVSRTSKRVLCLPHISIKRFNESVSSRDEHTARIRQAV